MDRKKLIIAISVGTLIILGLLFALSYSNKQRKLKLEQAKEGIRQDVNNSVGGVLKEDGFKIGYLKDGKVTITITKNPFAEYKQLAFAYLKKKGIDTSKENVIIFAAKDVDVDEEDLYK
ncbi:MAG: hypothetical protein UU65_C0002G0197 [candidate division CPR2 bacterium GW2011_GWC1_41_48]|uniref:Uncharacterized protein n=1 Tax=candidate division CPR2 bacterium GW2011_GWC1_41_48 TaxID=1618344 RepID=A0A0G0W8T8_UNCC2|nr:MAG: hypothetical protein UT47_C0002G0107 [candidate division CPR2 bacterium GW2011_GWC2_39_35]KKR27958.1 MAG: hypothetical protein UT60_C0031G0009 [candidate division CPR2 bacterium GW2011_GWD2_39_7]KKS09419.1 MAG: hypothetical protein UU65_C0002G0197 [candidate division CPR2 bacterium GW2011_GWC1_41_48]OGB72069.1 MAG: hypothetical protein A2Y26_01905 [candidate division CPR2 bacterium GWD2_39_7]